MSSYIYAATILTGGAAGALDKIDGTALADGDGAIVIVSGGSCYFYVLNATSAAAESSPAIIAPDTNGGDKRWIQVGVSGAVAFATWQEIAAGVITDKAVAPAQLEDSGVLAPPFSTAAEIVAGTVANKTIAPDQLKAANIIPVPFASAAEIATGTVATKAIAPDQLAHATAATGTGKIVRNTSPSLVTPALGTPSSGNLASCTFTGTILTDTLAIIYPVGCIYTTIVSTNPATVFGFGTWAAFGAGRVLVGVGTSDAAYAAAATGGESTHTLSAAESGLPAHTHNVVVEGNNAGNDAAYIVHGGTASGTLTKATSANTVSAASSAHNNLQPYIVVYFWKRTA